MATKPNGLCDVGTHSDAVSSTFHYQKAYCSFTLAAINVLIFLVMALKGSAEADQIYRKTAVLVPQALGAIDWWKLVAANFVHANLALLLQNMLFLCALGPFAEFVLGKKKFLGVYLASGIGAFFLVIIYARIFDQYVPLLRVHRPQIVGGASAAILGVIGALGAIFLRHWKREKSSLARNHFLFLLLIVLSQTAADLMHFNVAFGAHSTGAALGFALGLSWGKASFRLNEEKPITLAGTEKRG